MSGLRSCVGGAIVELLVASTLGLGVLLAAVQLLRTQVGIAVSVRTDLEAFAEARWALQSAVRDVKRSGADPLGRGFVAIPEADTDVLVLVGDFDADGLIHPASEETVRLRWSANGGGRMMRRVGRQSMSVAARVPAYGLRFRYFDAQGRSVVSSQALEDPVGIVRVGFELEVVSTRAGVSRGARLSTAGAVRVRPERRPYLGGP